MAGLVLGADLGLGPPVRSAQQDGPPAVGDRGRDAPVARDGRGGRHRRDVLASGPAGRLVEQGVLVQVRVGGQPVGGRLGPEDRPHGRPEDLGEVQVDGPHGPVEVDLLVHEAAGRQEHLERRQAGLVQGQAAFRDERVAAQPFGIHRPDGHAGQVGIAPHVVQVVDREHARQQRLEPAHPARHRRIARGPAWR